MAGQDAAAAQAAAQAAAAQAAAQNAAAAKQMEEAKKKKEGGEEGEEAAPQGKQSLADRFNDNLKLSQERLQLMEKKLQLDAKQIGDQINLLKQEQQTATTTRQIEIDQQIARLQSTLASSEADYKLQQRSLEQLIEAKNSSDLVGSAYEKNLSAIVQNLKHFHEDAAFSFHAVGLFMDVTNFHTVLITVFASDMARGIEPDQAFRNAMSVAKHQSELLHIVYSEIPAGLDNFRKAGESAKLQTQDRGPFLKALGDFTHKLSLIPSAGGAFGVFADLCKNDGVDKTARVKEDIKNLKEKVDELDPKSKKRKAEGVDAAKTEEPEDDNKAPKTGTKKAKMSPT